MKPRVLYVDDDESNLVCVSYALSDQFDLVTANCGDAALEVLGCSVVDAVIVDQRMPGMSGVELCRRIHDSAHSPPRVLYTAYVDADAAMDAVNTGRISRLLRKPASNEELREAITRVIEEEIWHADLSELQAKLVQGFAARGVAAACSRASKALPDSTTIVLCDLLLDGANPESKYDPVRRADEHLHDFFAEHGGAKGICRGYLTHVTSQVLRLLQPYLRCSVSISCSGDPLVFFDPPTYAHALLVLLQNQRGAVEVCVRRDADGEGWLHLGGRFQRHRLADALMGVYGGSVRPDDEGVVIGFSRWGDFDSPRPSGRDFEGTVHIRGERSESGIDVLFVGNEANGTLLQQQFSEFATMVCGCADEATTLVEEHQPTVVVTDEHLPGMLGTELSAWLRCHYPSVVPIVLSTRGDFAIAQRAAGVAHAVLPRDRCSDLRALLEECIRVARQQRAAQQEHHHAAYEETLEAFVVRGALLAEDLEQRAQKLQQVADGAGLGPEVADALRELDPDALRTP